MTMLTSPIEQRTRKLAATVSEQRLTIAAVAALTITGLLLRWWAARGELWLDEIWSLNLAAALDHPLAALWRISHDNNHFLNTIWMALLGQNAPVIWYRAPSIVMGGLSVVFAARIGLLRSRDTGLAAALLAACLAPMVEHGSEARGYSGLILCSLIAIDAWLRSMQHDGAARWPWVFAAAVGVGALFHLTAVALPAVCGLAMFLRLRPGSGLRQALAETAAFLRPAIWALLPCILALAAGIFLTKSYTLGGISAFSGSGFASGFGGMLAMLAGVPAGAGGWVAIVTGISVFAGLAAAGILRPHCVSLGVAALLAMPLTMAILQMPNTEFPRYFLVPGIVGMVLIADALGWAMARGGAGRQIGLGLFCAMLVANALSLSAFYESGRGSKRPVVEVIAASSNPAYTADTDFRVPVTIKHLAERHALAVTFVKPADICATLPLWFVVEQRASDGPPVAAFARKFRDCTLRFVRYERINASRTGGWALYRRD